MQHVAPPEDGSSSASADTVADAQWAFVLDFYARPGVSAACLELQDRLGVDVTVLLHAVWLQHHDGRALDDAAWARLDALVQPWRALVVHPLRALRRQLKSAPQPVPAPMVQQTRQLIAQAELSAERGALAALQQASRALPAASADAAANGDLVARIARFYAHGQCVSALTHEEVRAALATLQLAVDAVCAHRAANAGRSDGNAAAGGVPG